MYRPQLDKGQKLEKRNQWCKRQRLQNRHQNENNNSTIGSKNDIIWENDKKNVKAHQKTTFCINNNLTNDFKRKSTAT